MSMDILLGVDKIKLAVYKIAVLDVKQLLLKKLIDAQDKNITSLSIEELAIFAEELSKLQGEHLINGINGNKNESN